MLSVELLALALATFAAAPTALAHSNAARGHPHAPRYIISPRDYITSDNRLDSYDYIIAGGGLAGLVLASRLSEDPDTTVLVLEAGDSGDEEREKIDVPGATYYTSLLNTQYDYAYKTVPQPNVANREMNWPRGKTLGGSSAVNGMYLVRPSSGEIDTWHSLIADETNSHYADSWTWDSLYDSLRKSETFTPPTAEALETAGMRFNADSHGTQGPLHSTYPGYMIPITSAWLPTLAAAGVPISEDAYSGNNLGAFFSTMAIKPTNWTRSYSKSAYIDGLPPRPNLHILSSAAVTRIVFSDIPDASGNIVATGVEFARDRDSEVQSVNAAKEVLVAGGAVGSPQMLMVSGVGPRATLEEAGVEAKLDLPGVGAHMQDHLAAEVGWQTSEDTQGDIWFSGSELSQTPEFQSYVNTATAYVNGTWLFDTAENFNNFLAFLRDMPPSPSTIPQVAEGYRTIYNAYVENIYPNAGVVELLLSINQAGRITIQAALQTPLSQGVMSIASGSVFDAPVLDPRYLSHPADIVLLRQALKKIRNLSTHSPLRELLGTEVTPGPDVQTDEQWENHVRQSTNTEFHPGCTCAMLPREKGGVVGADLRVWGTANVRVIDGSVFPLSMSAHLMAPIYGLAERASELIRNPPSPAADPGQNGSANDNGSGSGGNGGASGTGLNNNVDNGNAAGKIGTAGWVVALVAGAIGLASAI